VLNHAALIDIELSKFPSLTTVFVANNTALTELRWSGSQPISSVELIDYNGTDAVFKSLPNLVDLKLSRMSNLNYLLIDDASLRSLDLSKVGGTPSSVGLYIDLFNISSTIGNVALVGGGGLENSLTGFEVADYRGGVTSLTLANLSRSLYYDLSGLAALKSIRMENIVLDGVQTKNVLPGVDMLIELVRVRASDGGTALGISHSGLAPDGFARVTAVRMIDNLAGSLFVADLPALRSLEVAGSSSLTDLYIGRTALTSLNLSGVLGRPDSLTIDMQGGISATPTAALPNNRLSMLRLAGGSGLEKSLVKVQLLEENTPGGVEAVDLVNLPRLAYLHINSLPALKSLRINNTGLTELYLNDIDGAPGALDMVLENVARQAQSGRISIELFGNRSGLLNASLVSFSLRDTTGNFGGLTLKALSALKRVTLGGVIDGITLLNVSSAELFGFAEVAPNTMYIEIRRSGIAALDLTRVPNAAQVIVTDNTKLSGVCRLPDAYAGTCEINNNAFYADANCASKCSGTVVPRGASNASSCVMPAKPAFCTGTNMIFFNVVNTAGGVDTPICLSFSSDPSRITSGACTVNFVQASAMNMVSFSSCSVSTSTLFATSIALVGTNTHFNVSLGQSANPGCGFVVNGNVPRIVTAGVTATSAVLCTSTSGCATAAPTPAPTPLPTPMPPSPSPSPSPTTRTASAMPTPRPASGVPTPSPTPTTAASGAATTTTDAAGSDSSTSADVVSTTSSESSSVIGGSQGTGRDSMLPSAPQTVDVALIGGVVGGIFALLVLVGIAIALGVLCQRRRKRRNAPNEVPMGTSTASEYGVAPPPSSMLPERSSEYGSIAAAAGGEFASARVDQQNYAESAIRDSNKLDNYAILSQDELGLGNSKMDFE
jgi:hypothetical protein